MTRPGGAAEASVFAKKDIYEVVAFYPTGSIAAAHGSTSKYFSLVHLVDEELQVGKKIRILLWIIALSSLSNFSTSTPHQS
jgi:hypothetical protein